MTPYLLGTYADLLARWLNDQSDYKAELPLPAGQKVPVAATYKIWVV